MEKAVKKRENSKLIYVDVREIKRKAKTQWGGTNPG
jgi:hypothetical protein